MDDVPEFLRSIKRILAADRMAVTTCLSPVRAIREAVHRPFDLVITTLVMKELGGFDVIRGLRSGGCAVPILMVTGHGSEQAAIEATRLGATDYMNKPVVAEELLARVRRIVQPAPAGPRPTPAVPFPGLVTTDPAMRTVLETVGVIAATDSRILITGETGTGKQVVARAIHTASPRRDEPFVDVNCAAIPDTLLESELFGHERGAFTGADARRIGRFEEAGRGTLFLDEIGEMNYAVQSKLLKVLQDGQFNRVGGQAALRSGARVIAATNRDLELEVAQGRFRSDLYYRLQVITLLLPPLRHRPGDVPILVEHFLQRFRRPPAPGAAAPGPIRFAPEAMQALMRYGWPGNVRELENMIERIAVLHRSGEPVGLDALPPRLLAQTSGPPSTLTSASPVTGQPRPMGSFRQAKGEFEREYVRAALAYAGGNMAEAARVAAMDRSQFFRMAKRHGATPR